MRIGDTVTIVQPSLFDKNHERAQTGIIVRMPLPEGQRKRLLDHRVMVKVSNRNRPRPVRPEHLI